MVPLAQIFPSYRKLAALVDELHRETEELRLQTLDIQAQRNKLQAQSGRLEKELQESRQRESELKDEAQKVVACQYERDAVRVLYEKLLEEKDALDKDLGEVRAELSLLRDRLWAPPGHVHSPVTDPNDPFVRRAVSANGETGALTALADRPDLPIDEPAQLALLGWLGEHGPRFPFRGGPAPDWRYYTQNGHFGHADAALMFAMLLEYKPSHLVEIGCGFASLLAMDVNDRFLDHNLDLNFFDPQPEGVLSLLPPLDSYHARVHAQRAQEVPDEVLAQLQRGDILSLETSHVARTGSDVCDILFRILPALAPGVLVHVHDIYYPFEYPESWVLQDNRSWNETYILRAFLQYSSTFRVLFFNDLMVRKYPAEVSAAFPGLEDTNASSLWLEKLK